MAELAQSQLLVFAFGPGADFGGLLVGALERLESGGTLRVLDLLFVQRDADTGELTAVDLRGHGAGSTVAPLLGFRLDAGERRRATERALGDRADPARAEVIRALGASLDPGAAVAAALIGHVWADALQAAVTHTGGTTVTCELVSAAAITELAPELLGAVRPAG